MTIFSLSVLFEERCRAEYGSAVAACLPSEVNIKDLMDSTQYIPYCSQPKLGRWVRGEKQQSIV